METNPGQKHISPDPDIFGLGVASLCATITMALGFWRGVDGFAIAVRVGLVFVVSYAVVFLFVRLAVRIVVGEMVEWNRLHEEEKAPEEGGDEEAPKEHGE